MKPPFLAVAGLAPSRALASERASLVVTAKQPGPAPLAFQSLPRSTFWAAAGSRATMRAGRICTTRPCRGLSRSGTTTAAAQTLNLEGTYALTFGCFHALAGSHDPGFVSRASRRFRSLAHLRGTSRSPLRTWMYAGPKVSLRDVLPGGGWACPNPPAERISDRRSLTPSRVRRCSRKPRRGGPAPSRINRPSAYTQFLLLVVRRGPVVHLEHSALGSTRRRSHRRQPDDALVDDEGTHGERRGG